MDSKIAPILKALVNYFEERDYKNKSYFDNPHISHYYNEIIRYKNKINFIINKTLRSLKENGDLDINDKTRYFYATYRFFWESASISTLKTELNIQENSLFTSFLKQLKSFSWKKALEGKTEIEKLSIIEAVPTFFINHLLPVMNIELIKKNILKMNNLNRNNDCTVRINSLIDPYKKKNLLSDIEHYLRISKIKYSMDKEVPELIHVPVQNKINLVNSQFYKNGSLIFQDKASAVAVKVLNPKPNDLILDMCAAPGMKTSLIAQYSNNKSKIIGGEFSYYRALNSIELLDHLKVSNFYMINTDSIQFPLRDDQKFDKILLDVPCTGSGTFLTNPELKWRQNDGFLYQNTNFQEKLLKNALKMLKSGGIIVYSTCSLYPEEGELQIQKIINQLEPLPLPDWVLPSYPVEGKSIPGTGRLFPSFHGTQGFFISKFRKN